jgi:hypothetical protein
MNDPFQYFTRFNGNFFKRQIGGRHVESYGFRQKLRGEPTGDQKN